MGKENVDYEKRKKEEPLEDLAKKAEYFSVIFEKRVVERNEIREFSRNHFMLVNITIIRSLGLILEVIANL